MRALVILIFISFNSLGQGFGIAKEEEEKKLSKCYLGIGGGVALRGGDINYWNNYSTGINITLLNLGYRINETFGISANWNSSGHGLYNSSSSLGVAYFSIGGIVSIPTKQFTIDIKPQYAPLVAAEMYGDIIDATGNIIYENIFWGDGFVIGSSIVRSTKRGITYSLDLDYLSSIFSNVRINGLIYDDRSIYNSFRIGVGVRYNFGRK